MRGELPGAFKGNLALQACAGVHVQSARLFVPRGSSSLGASALQGDRAASDRQAALHGSHAMGVEARDRGEGNVPSSLGAKVRGALSIGLPGSQNLPMRSERGHHRRASAAIGQNDSRTRCVLSPWRRCRRRAGGAGAKAGRFARGRREHWTARWSRGAASEAEGYGGGARSPVKHSQWPGFRTRTAWLPTVRKCPPRRRGTRPWGSIGPGATTSGSRAPGGPRPFAGSGFAGRRPAVGLGRRNLRAHRAIGAPPGPWPGALGCRPPAERHGEPLRAPLAPPPSATPR